MTLHLTVSALAAAYDYLCEFEPFSKWNMPPSEDVKFNIIRADHYAHYQMVDGVHHISISAKLVGRHESLMSTLSHEMAHLHIRAANIPMRTPHGKAFQKLADEICKIHEFDRLAF